MEMKPRHQAYRFRALVMMLGIVMLVGTTVQCTGAQSRTEQIIRARAEAVTGDRFTINTTTRRGVRVYAVRMPSAEMLRAIDDGFAELLTVARRHGYSERLNPSDYTVYIARADRLRDSRGAYSPDVAVSSGQYAGSVYDQGGYIYVAGMVLEFNHCIFVIAEHDRDLRRVSDIVRYEGEHLVLYHNDRALYQRTADHSRGGGHPILQ
jgi:hypothetical protein